MSVPYKFTNGSVLPPRDSPSLAGASSYGQKIWGGGMATGTNPYLSEDYVEGTIKSTCRHCGSAIVRGYWDEWVRDDGTGRGSHGCKDREFIYDSATHTGYYLPHEATPDNDQTENLGRGNPKHGTKQPAKSSHFRATTPEHHGA